MTKETASGGLRVVLFGGTGTIGRAVAAEVIKGGHSLTCVIRKGADRACLPAQSKTIMADPADRDALIAALGNRSGDPPIDAVISCLASRTGSPKDAWATDYGAHCSILGAAEQLGIQHMVLLSAICVQKPKLAFQHAKLRFEDRLKASSLTYSIVRPTAYFKSLSGQVARVKAGKPYLMFGNGEITACKPISDHDLARYLVMCLTDPEMRDKVLPVGGPSPVLTPRDMAAILFRQADQPPTFKSIPPALFKVAAWILDTLGLVIPPLRDKAEFARTAHYYATESMLVWDETRLCYDADATPEFGTQTLEDHYGKMIREDADTDLGAHALFDQSKP